MTISSLVTETGPYTGTNTTDTFAYTFRILAKTDLLVTHTPLGGSAAVLVVDTDYTVTGVGADAGGNVVLTAGNLATGATLFIVRVTPLTQLTDYSSQGSFLPQTYEDALDKVTMAQQENATAAVRAIVSPTSEPAIDLTLPIIASRGGMLLEFDSAGLPVTAINAAAAAAAISTALASGVAVTLDSYTGTGINKVFSLSAAPASVNGMLVTVDGVVQAPTVDYQVTTSTLEFLVAPPLNAKIVLRNFGNANNIIQVNQRGQALLAAGTKFVTLVLTAPTANYRLSLSPNANETVWWSGKSTGGFTINSSNGASTALVDWLLSY